MAIQFSGCTLEHTILYAPYTSHQAELPFFTNMGNSTPDFTLNHLVCYPVNTAQFSIFYDNYVKILFKCITRVTITNFAVRNYLQ